MSTQAITKQIKLRKDSKEKFINAMESKPKGLKLGKKENIRVE